MMNRVKFPVEWWAPSIAGVAVVSFISAVIGLVLGPKGEFGGMILMVILAGLAVYGFLSVVSILVIDLVMSSFKNGHVPTNALAFLTSILASAIPLLIGYATQQLAPLVLAMLIVPVVCRIWIPR